jgi:hypothetical protein
MWTKIIVHWSFLLPILWFDSCWQLSTRRRRISHIWLYRSEKKVIFLKNHTIYWWLVLCLLGANFLATWLGKVGRYKRYKGVFFFWEKMSPKSSYYDKDNLKSPYLENRFNKSSNYMRNLKIFYFPLYPLINSGWFLLYMITYFTNLGKKNK